MRLTVLLAPLALALTLALALAHPALALAESPSADNATSAQPAKGTRLSEVLVTATSHEARVDAVPNAVTVITREQIDQMVAPTTIDILKNAAGVQVYNARGPLSSSTYNRVIMRGQGSNSARILVLLNGLPQTASASGDFEWSFINPRDIERIEVVRGPGSALYGSQAMGGVINIITRKPTEEKGVSTLETTYGTLNTASLSASHSQKSGDWGFYGSGTVGGTQGYRVASSDAITKSGGQPINSRNIRSRNDWGRGVVSYDIDPSSKLNLNMMHGHFVNRGMYDYMPDFQLFEMYKKQADLSYAKRFEDGEFLAYASTAYQFSTYDGAASPAKTMTGTSPSWQRDYQGGMNVNYGLGAYNTVSGGVDVKRATYDRRYDNYATAGDAYASNGGDLLVYGAFLQDELKLFDGRVLITPGMRYEYTSLFDGYNEQRAANPRKDVDKRIVRALTSRIGARYTATDWLSFRTAYGESFRSPTLNELYGLSKIGTSTYYGNDALKPERLKSIEGGVDITPLADLRLSVTVYKNHATDYIDNVLVAANTYNKQNIGTVDTGGIETELEYTFWDYWRSFVNYQRCDPKLMNGTYMGQRVTGTPLSTTSVGLSFNDPKLFTLSAVNRWVGKIFSNANNTTAYGKYDVLDMKLAKAFALEASKLEFSLAVSNVLDVHVQETSASEAPGRLITAGVAWIF
jgi:outer membrane cobalamin receptor